MAKQKLINKRKSQKINQSQYSRRENGISKLSKNEWYKLAEILNTTLIKIYEDEDDVYSNVKIDSLFSDTSNKQLFNVETNTFTKHIQKLET